jgi:thiosulfate/3-mercaptopyruvate sulfurtransferase
LKRGHIPTAVNLNYEAAWTDPKTKHIKSYGELQVLFKGLDTAKGVIVYCNSGRRSAFSYFILRLMGFENVYTYENSWKEWGNPENFLPVETRKNQLAGSMLPEPATRTGVVRSITPQERRGEPASGGYVSCGG